MSYLVLESYAADDPLGSPQGTLTRLMSKRALCEPNAVGTLQVTYHRDETQRSWLTPGSFILARIGATATDVSADPFEGYWLDEMDDTMLSEQERGGANWQRQGRSAIVYLEEATVWHVLTGSPSYTIDTSGNVLWVDVTTGTIMADLIDEAQARGCIPGVTYDFDASTDSAGAAWDDTLDKYQLPIGLDLLSVVNKLRSAGFTVTMSAGLVLSVYQDWDFGSSGVSIVAGENIRSSASRKGHDRARSTALVQGAQQTGALKYRVVTNSGYESELGRRKETFYRYGATPTNSALDRAGNAVLHQQHARWQGIDDIGHLIRAGEIPFDDYRPGQTVAVTIPGLYSATDKLVHNITIVDTSAGEADAIIGFEATPYDPLDGLPSAEPTTNDSGGHTCNDCPPAPPPFTPGTPGPGVIGTGACEAHTSGLGFPTYVQAGYAAGDEPAAGDLVVFAVAVREGTLTEANFLAGWTILGSATMASSGGELAFRVILAAIIADPTGATSEQPTAGTFRLAGPVSNVSFRAGVLTIPGGTLAGIVANEYNTVAGTDASMSVAATGAGVVVTAIANKWINTITDGAGFTTWCTGLGSNGSNLAPRGSFAAQSISGAGTITNAATIGQGGKEHGGVIAFIPGGAVDSGPRPVEGREIVEQVTVTRSGGITSFETTEDDGHGYIAGSLRVWVQNREISSANFVEDDPAAGTAHLTWQIQPYETVTIRYQRGYD